MSEQTKSNFGSGGLAGMPAIAHQIWNEKYRFKKPDGTPIDTTIEDTWRRVARALAQAEKPIERATWEERFFAALEGFRFLPGGRILAGAGTGRNVTLFNCYVLGTITDSMPGIFDALKDAALTMQQGGGIGHDFSTLRPKGAPVRGVGADASGPLPFMDCWDAMCKTIMSAGARRGAMMGTLRCDHPDIETFIEAKRDPLKLRNFNVSVLVTRELMEAVEADADFQLRFAMKTYRTVRARELFEKITRAAYDCADPGVLFIDRVNDMNNLAYCETIACSNPCGEQFLPPYGACLLGSINLAALVKKPFTDNARIDQAELAELVFIAVRMLDNVIDISNFPLEAQRQEAKAKRRIGIGVTGLADALAMCGLYYGSEIGRRHAAYWMSQVTHCAYNASSELAHEKGRFPALVSEQYLQRPFIQHLPEDVRSAIARYGVRNSHLTSIAPTGTISLLAGNVSSGIEPIFGLEYPRKILMPDGSRREEIVQDYAVRKFRTLHGTQVQLPPHFVCAHDLTPSQHLLMQAALQPHIDSAISKTVNCPEKMTFEEFRDLYIEAYRLGLKGCTAYRPNNITGVVLGDAPSSDISATAKTELHSPVAAREKALSGVTYQLKWPLSEHAIYITINNHAGPAGILRPFEIFINSKNLEHYAWTVALTRMISAIFRRGGDVSFVVEELKAVFDPRGGAWIGGKYVPSLLAAIGEIIEQHFDDCGALIKERGANPTAGMRSSDERDRTAPQADHMERLVPIPQTFCSKCSSANVVHEEGCKKCRACGYSTCA